MITLIFHLPAYCGMNSTFDFHLHAFNMKGFIDRIESEQAVIVLENKQSFNIPVDEFDFVPEEGMAINIMLEPDIKETQEKLSQVKNLITKI